MCVNLRAICKKQRNSGTSSILHRSRVISSDRRLSRYNGRQTDAPKAFPAAMAEACEYVEKIVNAEMRKRSRFPLEWGGEPAPSTSSGSDKPAEKVIWRANVAASNRYEGSQESVGFHSDQLTNIGPFATIASLSLGES
jgi:hypothetical protein